MDWAPDPDHDLAAWDILVPHLDMAGQASIRLISSIVLDTAAQL